MLKRLRAKNFKSLRSLDLPLGPLSALAGPNMGGKSNVVDALRFLLECWFPQPGTNGPPNAIGRRGGMDEVLWKGERGTLLSVGVEFEDPSQPAKRLKYDIELVGGATGYINIQEERLVLEEGGTERPLIIRDAQSRWLVNSNSERLVSVEAQRSAMETAPPNWDGYPLKWFAQNWRFYQLVPSVMKLINPVGAGAVLNTDGSNLSAWLMWIQTRSPDSFRRIEEVARDVFPGVRKLLTWPTQQTTVYLTSEEKNLLRPTPVSQMSDGELVFIAFLSLICAPDDLSGTAFFVEEPENHLHPRLIETLLGLLRQVQQEATGRDVAPSQIILTTHSPFVLNQLKLDEVIWVQKNDGETMVVRPCEKRHLRRLVEDKELGIGDLAFTGALGGD